MRSSVLHAGVFALCVLLSSFRGVQAADIAALWQALKQTNAVALVRHARTSGGAGDPPGFRLEDCATQRNLSEQGRAEARELGERFRRERIVFGQVLSSRWCRCQETAALMNVGVVETNQAFDNAFVLRARVHELTEGARAIIANWQGPGPLLVVTHGANILPLTGIQPGEGDIVVVVPEPATPAKLRVLGLISVTP